MPESALCAVARARGAACLEVDGWTVPAAFGDAAAEYRALRDDAAIVDLAFRARARVSGRDRIDFLQGMLSNDIKVLAPGRGCHALLLTDQGKVVADLVVLAVAEAILLDGIANVIGPALHALERYVVADDVELSAPSDADHEFGLYGPRAAQVLARLGVATPPADDYAHEVVTVQGSAVRIVRTPTPGAGGFLCVVARTEATAWWGRCVEGGSVAAAGQRALEALRVESGVPWDGRDMGLATIALEAPLEEAISFKKGCYLGQEVIERVSSRGHVNRRLIGLEIDGESVPDSGDRIFAGTREVGHVTSAVWSWRLARPLALGYVRREHLAPGTTLEVRGAAGGAIATVRNLPLV